MLLVITPVKRDPYSPRSPDHRPQVYPLSRGTADRVLFETCEAACSGFSVRFFQGEVSPPLMTPCKELRFPFPPGSPRLTIRPRTSRIAAAPTSFPSTERRR